MKPHVILLLTTDPTVEALAQQAVLATRHGLRVLRSGPDAIRQFKEGCADIDAAIIDLDPGMHGSALLEAAGDRLPVLVISSLEDAYIRPIAERHGARGCLVKPFDAAHFQAAIEQLLPTSSATAVHS